MSVNSRVINALSGVIPVKFGSWSGDVPEQYAVFIISSTPGTHADNQRRGWRHYIYLTMWSKGSYVTTKDTIITAMESAGFSTTDINEGYEEDTHLYRCAFTFFLLEAV